ncbi:MAG: tRNA pseudouridine(13) synthase TruD [Nanoarchaeota archaeon]|nr:tRNA pseudouridine(13) synthase TruD [Nanoarchaeota archaeon]MBU1644016.1 tRNA pseudouridine(13) synthase TruD [Nanoarchaeota archaeon]MBU1976911.1 tRNA pseudouridine(13) synthase TruD [Nanoarchaeota archaeon]
MYILKQQPEDFIVKEISNVRIEKNGNYLYFRLKKRLRNTLDVIKEIAKQSNIKEKNVGFAGNKDKHALTEQVISILGVGKEKVKKIQIDNVELEFLGSGNKPISLGDLEGNHFEIVIRNLEDYSLDKTNYLENYFDEQRFSVHNVDVGRHLVKKEFKEAVKLMDDSRANKHLEKHKNDSIGALKKLPLRLLRMYVNAYQSYLWNETVSRYLTIKGGVLKEVEYSLGKLTFISDPEKFLDLTIPLIGFSSEEIDFKDDFKDDSEGSLRKIITEVMEMESLDYTDFIIKQIPELSQEGMMRPVFIAVKDLKLGKEERDDLNLGMKKIKVEFSLPKGSYATMVIRRVVDY